MVTWVLRCKLYPGATPWRSNRFARPLRGGGLILRAIAGLDRWLSRQNPAYRPASHYKNRKHRLLSGAFSFSGNYYRNLNASGGCLSCFGKKDTKEANIGEALMPRSRATNASSPMYLSRTALTVLHKVA